MRIIFRKKNLREMSIFNLKKNKIVRGIPLESRRKDPGIGYRTIAVDMCNFKRMGELPVSFEQLDFLHEDGLCILLEQHKAKWHKSCRNKYNNTKYDRLQKHTLTAEAEATITLTADARTSKRIKISISIEKSTYQCFLCDKPATLGDLRHASTFGVESKIRRAALQLNDTHLLAKLIK